MGNVTKRLNALAVVVLTVTMLAACGSSSKTSSSTSAAAAGSSTTAGATSSAATSAGGSEVTLPTGKMTCGATADSDNACALKVAPAGKSLKVGFFGLANNTYTTSLMKQGAISAKQLGVEFTPVLNAFDPNQEANQLQDAVAAHKFDAYIIEPVSEPSLKQSLAQLVQQKIPFGAVTLTMGTNVASAKIQYPGMTVQVSRTLASQGQDLAVATNEACAKANPCHVGLMEGVANFPYDKEQEGPFKAELAKFSNIKLDAITYGGYTNATGLKTAQDLLTAHPDLNVVASFGDNQSLGIYDAIKGAGKAGQIKITSVGGTADAVKEIKAGKWFASTVALPYNEMVVAMNAVVGAARGVKTSIGVADMTALGNSFPHVLTQANESQWAGFKGQWVSGG
jgi:ribose transport system substrate-binding protein